MTIHISMNPPTGFGGLITGLPSGNVYNVASSAAISVLLTDVSALLALGFQAPPNAVSNIGVAGVGTTALEYGDLYNHTTVLAIAGVLPAIAGGAALGLGLLLYTLPVGAQIVNAAHMNIGIKQTQGHITADTPKVGLGTTIASGVVSVLSGTAGFQNIVTGQSAADCDGTKTVITTLATASPFGLVTEIAGAKTIYFNAAATWAASGDAAALVQGSVILNWRQMA